MSSDERRERWERAAHEADREVDRNTLRAYMAVADAECAEHWEQGRTHGLRQARRPHDARVRELEAEIESMLALEEARSAAWMKQCARVRELEAETERLRGLIEDVESAVWVSPDRHSGSACIGGTRIPAHIIAGLVPDVGPGGVADFYPSVGPEAARVAVWFRERYTDRADHDETEVASARDRARQIAGEGEHG